MKKLSLAIFLVTSSLACFSQSFFQRLPKSNVSQPSPGIMSSHTSIFTGTDKWMFRPIASLVSYSIPGNAISTGVGVAYELVSQDPSTQVYSSVVSFSALVNYSLPLDADHPANAIGGSVFLGLLDNHILVGTKYDGKRFNLEIGTAINFLN